MDFYGISASNFAETIEVPRSSISHILSGRNKPSLEFVLKTIETYQEVDLYWLLKGIGNFPKSTPSLPKSTPVEIKNKTIATSLVQKVTQKTKEVENVKIEKEASILQANLEIEKVLIFYTNGTFKEYKNQTSN